MTLRAAEEFSDPDVDYGRLRAYGRRFLHLAREKLPAWLAQDIVGLSLWAPVSIGAGVGLYFGLKIEPHWIVGVGGMALAVFCRWLFAQQGAAARKIMAALFLAALGFAAADWRTEYVSAPVLQRDLNIKTVTGSVVFVEDRASARRIVIALDSIAGVDQRDLPARARITWRGAEFNAAPGDRVRLRAGLGPPPRPAAPGTFDFARQLYFQKIGAVGFAVSAPQIIESHPKTRSQKLAAWIETHRAGLLKRITSAAPGEGGGIVAAVVTGKRDAITARSAAALRDTGLAHLLAISGLHMGLATGLIFFAVRFGLAAIEPLALHFPIKKWAAAAALGSGFFYLILSGGGWSARRAFIMTAIMFTAILVDRRALSLRNVAIAAVIILLITPEALFSPGFQMSFAAVTSLIAGYEWASRHANPHRSFTLSAKIKRYTIGLAATDTIAALATAPYALYHFNRVAIYSLPANVLAMPLMGFWIIPTAVLALVLTPFGLDGWAWRFSAQGMETVLAIASEVARWPGAVSLTAQWPLAAMLTLTMGGLWLCLARSPLRFLGLAAMPMAALLVSAAAPAQIYVASSGLNAAVISGDGAVTVYNRRRDRFSLSVWREASGLNGQEDQINLMSDVSACDSSGCIMTMPGGAVISFISDGAALREDCQRADLVIAFFPVNGADWRACAATLIDRRSVWRRGAHAVWFDPGGGLRIKTVGGVSGKRPWTGD